MDYTSVTNLRWQNADHTRILCDVVFPALGAAALSFCADPNDVEAHGREIFERAAAGEFGAVGAYVAPTPAPPPVLTRTYKADIWRRATDAEAETIDTDLKAQPIRMQRMWQDALWLETTDDLYPTMLAAFQAAFGEARAAELLAPTE